MNSRERDLLHCWYLNRTTPASINTQVWFFFQKAEDIITAINIEIFKLTLLTILNNTFQNLKYK